ncbi:hypothetical protein PG310_00360 [Riemerella anatipestifer]|uniref:hypothetical protein n=1 Tax=Riemerella anatipestifer TaxID=34085 RepID=UPI002A87D848|nr:hypothetical protein [Riemerella anatipestifer]
MAEVLYYILNIGLAFLSVKTIGSVIQAIYRKQITGYVIFLPVYIIFFILPIFFDTLLGLGYNPDYHYITEAMGDILTNNLYLIYNVLLLLVFNYQFKYLMRFKTKKLDIVDERISLFLLRFFSSYKLIIFLSLATPFIIYLYYGADSYYSTYIGRTSSLVEIPAYHSFLSKIILLNIFLCSVLVTIILIKSKVSKLNIYVLILPIILLLLFYFWLHGKRSIVANYFLFQFILLLITGVISFKRMMGLAIIALISFVSFISFYGKNISSDSSETYYKLRTDFSRDYGVKFTIYNDIIIDRPILPEKLATFKFNALFFLPRSVYPNKPQPYAVYFTNSAFGNFGGDRLYGWGLTTSVFAESISNLGFMGLLFAPLVIMYIMYKEAKSNNSIFKLLSIAVSTLLLLLQPISFMVIILIYIILLIKGNKRYVVK